MKGIEPQIFARLASRKRQAENKVGEVQKRLRNDKAYSDLETSRDLAMFERAKLGSQNRDISSLNKTIDDLNKELEKRMEELSFKKEDLIIRYTCQKCKDTGMIKDEYCECFNRLKAELLQEEMGSVVCKAKDYKEAIKAIDGKYVNNYKGCYSFLHDFAKAFPKTDYHIIGIIGGVGTGKSYAASILANILTENGFSALMISAQKMNNIFLRYHLAAIEDKEDIFEPLKDAELLIIDDLGTENILKNVTIDYLYSLLNERYDKFTLFTSNCDIKSLEDRYGQRIISRLTDKNRSAFFNLIGSDLRI